MRALKAAGWQTITLAQFTAFIREGKPLPENSFLLTFDDGRADTFYSTDSVLKDLNYTAVMYVITGFSMPNNAAAPINSFYLSKSELSFMNSSGRWELESHGDLDHYLYTVPIESTDPTATSSVAGQRFLSNKFWVPSENRVETNAEFIARVTGDADQSKSILDSDFDRNVTTFAFPYNDYGQDTVNFPGSQAILVQVLSKIYNFGFYQVDSQDGSNTFNYPDPAAFLEKRIEPGANWSGQDLLAVLETGEPKTLPYAPTSFGGEWKSNWGNETGSTTVDLKAIPSTSGALTFLDGSYWWTNYKFKATIHWISGQDVSLMARYKDNKNYVLCEYTPTRILLEQYLDGTVSTLDELDYVGLAPGQNLPVTAYVSGNFATCTITGIPDATVASNNVSPELSTGGIGFKIWDPNFSTAAASFSSVSATAI